MSRIHFDRLPPVEELTPEQQLELFGAGPRKARLGLESLEAREVMTTGVTTAMLGAPVVRIAHVSGASRGIAYGLDTQGDLQRYTDASGWKDIYSRMNAPDLKGVTVGRDAANVADLVFAQGVDNTVYRLQNDKLTVVGRQMTSLQAGKGTLYGLTPKGQLFVYQAQTNTWRSMGLTVKSFSVGQDRLGRDMVMAQTQDNLVWRCVTPGRWVSTRIKMRSLVVGQGEAFGLDMAGRLYNYTASGVWQSMKQTGKAIIIGKLSPGQDQIFLQKNDNSIWYNHGNQWVNAGAKLTQIQAAQGQVFGLHASGALMRFDAATRQWTNTGKVGKEFALGTDAAGKNEVYLIDQAGQAWDYDGKQWKATVQPNAGYTIAGAEFKVAWLPRPGIDFPSGIARMGMSNLGNDDRGFFVLDAAAYQNNLNVKLNQVAASHYVYLVCVDVNTCQPSTYTIGASGMLTGQFYFVEARDVGNPGCGYRITIGGNLATGFTAEGGNGPVASKLAWGSNVSPQPQPNPQPQPVFQARTTQPATATNFSGRTAVVWTETTANGTTDIKLAIRQNGILISSNVTVATGWTTGVQPSVAIASDGYIVVAWTGTRDGRRDVWAMRVDASGKTRSFPIEVGTTGTQEDDPSVAMSDSGDFVVSYTEVDANGSRIRAKMYNDDGTLLRDLSVGGSGQQSQSQVARNFRGDFVIAWQEVGSDQRWRTGVTFFYQDGKTAWSQYLNTQSHTGSPSIDINNDGHMIIAYQSWNNSDWDIKARWIAYNGTQGQEMLVMGNTGKHETRPSVSMHSYNGNWVVSFNTDESRGLAISSFTNWTVYKTTLVADETFDPTGVSMDDNMQVSLVSTLKSGAVEGIAYNFLKM